MASQASPGKSLEGTGSPEIQRTWLRLSSIEWLIVALGAALLLANLFAAKPLLSANDRSRWATVWELVERGTFQIDEIDRVPTWSTIDKVQHEGHLYSSKPPLLSVIVAGIYAALKAIAGFDLLTQTDDTARLCLLVVNWLPATLSFFVFARLLRQLSDDLTVRAIALATLCCGTLVTSYATTLNNHSPAAISLVFALGPIFSLATQTDPKRSDYVLAGFWAAAVACFELPAALLGVITFLLATRRSIKLTAIWFIPAAMIPLGAYFITNGLATGSWKPFYASYGTEKYLFVRDGIPSYWMQPRGLDRNLDSPLTYFIHCTVGHHGILSLTPIYLLTLVSCCCRSLWKKTQLEALTWITMGLTTAVLGFYLSRTENYNYGGNTFGLRWILWLSPLWIVSLIPVLQLAVRRRVWFIFSLLLLMGSAYSAQLGARNPWSESWLFHQMTQAGWIDYSDPPPQFPFERKLQTWFTELPERAHVEFVAPSTNPNAPLEIERLVVTSPTRDKMDDRTIQALTFETRSHQSFQTLTVKFDVERFYQGETTDRCLIASNSKPEMSRNDVLTFLRGVPLDRPYSPGVVRYLKTNLQTDAIRTQRAASQVRWKSATWGGEISLRCDLWLSDATPLGVIQFEHTQTSPSGEELSRRRYRVAAIESK